jgi:hypothetical protein
LPGNSPPGIIGTVTIPQENNRLLWEADPPLPQFDAQAP